MQPEGGILTTVEGFKYPMRGLPIDFDLNRVDSLKRAAIANIGFLLSFPITPNRFLNALAEWMGSIYRVTFKEGKRKPPNQYCESAQEVRRVLEKLDPYKDKYEGSDWIGYIVEIWETDQAYRFRPQDIIPEANLENLKKNPRKEIIRLLELMKSREVEKFGGQVPKMNLVIKTAKVILLSKRISQAIASFLLELDMDKIRLNINDRYWCANKFDYNYEGKTYEERMAWRNEEDKNWVQPVENIPIERPRIGIEHPNEAFYKLSRKEAEKMCRATGDALLNNWREMQKV